MPLVPHAHFYSFVFLTHHGDKLKEKIRSATTQEKLPHPGLFDEVTLEVICSVAKYKLEYFKVRIQLNAFYFTESK